MKISKKSKKNLDNELLYNEILTLKLVSLDGTIIRSIPNPSERIQLAAVKQNPHSIQFIKNPYLSTQIYVVEIDGNLIDFIVNPSQNVQIKAVQQCPTSIQFIKEPCEDAQYFAVKKLDSKFQFFMYMVYNKINYSMALKLLYNKIPKDLPEHFKERIKAHPNFKSDAQLVLEAIK